MAMHPRESTYGRREFLGRSAAGVVGLSSLGALLAACGGSDNGNFKPPELQLARPESPVKWPLFDDNPMVGSGLEPESGTLRIFNWNGYLWPKIKKDFAKEYGVKVEETFFSTTDEAVAKISSGAVDFDVFFPTQDRIGRLVIGKSLQPLNHDYLPNLANVWPSVQDPWYDKESRYTVPYVTWTTGIGYRTDHVPTTPNKLSNPYEIYWDEANRGKLFLLDDSRDAPAHMLLKNGIQNINTEDPDEIELAKNELKSLYDVNVKLSTDDYTNLPEGRAWVHQMWSGSAISAQWYLPEGIGVEALASGSPRTATARSATTCSRFRGRRRTQSSRTTSSTTSSTTSTGTTTSRTTWATSPRSRSSIPTGFSRTESSRRTCKRPSFASRTSTARTR
jgi:spermidine/putrescine transport system substrate-binding protein